MKLAVSLLVSGIAALAAGTETKVKLPNSRADLLNGGKLFHVHCALCHGPNGEGGRGPLLTRAKLPRAPEFCIRGLHTGSDFRFGQFNRDFGHSALSGA